METSKKIDEYIEKHKKWSNSLSILRKLFLKTELIEEVKWGAPTYTYQGTIVLGIGAFKNHYAIWFHQGIFLKDEEKKLINAQDGKTKALRQWKFTEEDSINESLILKYVEESIINTKAGKKLKPQKKKEVSIPSLLEEAFTKNKALQEAFFQLTSGKQREYIDHISGAKREATQISRLEKSTTLILEGKGLYDKYKNC